MRNYLSRLIAVIAMFLLSGSVLAVSTHYHLEYRADRTGFVSGFSDGEGWAEYDSESGVLHLTYTSIELTMVTHSEWDIVGEVDTSTWEMSLTPIDCRFLDSILDPCSNATLGESREVEVTYSDFQVSEAFILRTVSSLSGGAVKIAGTYWFTPSVAEVPLPGAFGFMGVALLSLAGVRKRRR